MIYLVTTQVRTPISRHSDVNPYNICGDLADRIKVMAPLVAVCKGVSLQKLHQYGQKGDVIVRLSALVGDTSGSCRRIKYPDFYISEVTRQSFMLGFYMKYRLSSFEMVKCNYESFDKLCAQQIPCCEILIGNLRNNADLNYTRSLALPITQCIADYVNDFCDPYRHR